MNRQSQWLFESVPTQMLFPGGNPEYYHPKSQAEWELKHSINLQRQKSQHRSQCLGKNEISIKTVRGFSRYQQSIQSLPKNERAKIDKIARLVVNSFRTGCYPVRVIRLLGHADRDWQRGQDFEKKISAQRALAVQKALTHAIDLQSSKLRLTDVSPPISSQIIWRSVPVGANQLVVNNPKTEQERMLNRRVEISLITKPEKSSSNKFYEAPPPDPPLLRIRCRTSYCCDEEMFDVVKPNLSMEISAGYVAFPKSIIEPGNYCVQLYRYISGWFDKKIDPKSCFRLDNKTQKLSWTGLENGTYYFKICKGSRDGFEMNVLGSVSYAP